MSEGRTDKPDGVVLYRPPGTEAGVALRLSGRTAWLTQAQMVELFQTTKQNISLHIRNILAEGELSQETVVKEYLTTAADGKSYWVKHFSLDMILAVGYRVKSDRGTAFRKWATTTLREYLTKGFVLDEWRLKEGRNWGDDFFEELLAKIRDIRASEKRFYQKITDIYATSIDYDAHAAVTRAFFATVQNKLHWAIHGHTAAEIVVERADANKPNMGLTTWKHAPGGPVRRTDVTVAKNYLSAEEIDALNRVVTMYLDYAEDQAKRKSPMYMADWVKKLDGFLAFNERNILDHAGTVTTQMAEQHAEREFEKFDRARLAREAAEPSDFDKFLDQAKKLEPADKPVSPKKRRKRGE